MYICITPLEEYNHAVGWTTAVPSRVNCGEPQEAAVARPGVRSAGLPYSRYPKFQSRVWRDLKLV